MKIRLPKPDINCPNCGSKDKIDCGVEQVKKGMSIYWFFQCKACGEQYDINLVFEEEPKICDCEVCEKIKN
jgi:transcription elongation factor Elf1